ncbi:MAG: SDR family NAD(P)-dependent oxidoreductase [Pseudomonadota bacterium]
MNARFQDQVIWITGASSGIGRAVAVLLGGEGAHLILSGRRVDALEETAAAAPGTHMVLPFEATDYDRLDDITAKAFGWHGRIDMLFNNAGVSQRSTCLETDMAVYRQLMEIDVFAPIALTKAVLPKMVEAGSGHIAVVSSVAGKFGAPKRTGYCAAKHALQGFFDALRSEVTHLGLGVSLITPGFVNTAIARNALTGSGAAQGHDDADIASGMPVDTAAGIIVDGLAKRQDEIPVARGRELEALWLKRLWPSMLTRKLAKMGAAAANG